MHVVEAFAPLRDELRDQLRRILAVGIEDQHRVVADMVQARGERGFLAEVARQAQQRDARIARGDRLQHRPRRIAAAVVDVQHATGQTVLRQSVEHGLEARMQQRERFGLVEGGDEDGQPGLRLAGAAGELVGAVRFHRLF